MSASSGIEGTLPVPVIILPAANKGNKGGGRRQTWRFEMPEFGRGKKSVSEAWNCVRYLIGMFGAPGPN